MRRRSVREEHNAIGRDIELLRNHVREGRFQRGLAGIVALASLASGLEVAYEHYRGSYGQRVMYTPVVLSAALAGAGMCGVLNRWAARVPLRAVSAVTLADALLGFYFHVRGIARKPGGWSLPLTNITMGPPLFAPLLFGTAAYLGIIASYLAREGDVANEAAVNAPLSFAQDIREGRFQQHLLAATALSAMLSGAEAWYSHNKTCFRYRSQWWPVVLAPLLASACAGGIRRRRLAVTAVPVCAIAAMAVSGAGFFYHARGIVRRPGGAKHLLYNIIYGPPIFAPLLFGAAGALGLLASQLRRSGA